MKGLVRALTILGGVFLLVVVAAIYPATMRGSAWLSANWEAPWFLAALALIPLALYAMTALADARTPRILFPTVRPLVRGPRGWRARLRDVPAMVRAAALVLAILALARPQNVLRGEQAEEEGIDIFLLLDLSGSMRAVMDGQQGQTEQKGKQAHRATRLDTAKEVILDFIGRRKTDRIGVVVFGRAAYVLSPSTLDYTLLSGYVKQMSLDLIDGKGTAIGDALGTGVAHLRRSTARSKVAILLTDGDNNAGVIAPEYATHLAKTQGIKTYTVQIGNGDEVEVDTGRTDIFGQPVYVKERFPVNPELLKKIASETGGESFVANDKLALEKSMHAILDQLEKTRFEAGRATVEDLFPFLLLPAVLLVALEVLVRLLVLRRFP